MLLIAICVCTLPQFVVKISYELYNMDMVERYLENHLETPSRQKESNSIKESPEEFRRLSSENVLKDLCPELRYEKEGTQRTELQEGGILTFSYEEVSPALIEEFKLLLGDVAPTFIQDLESGRFRRLGSLIIETVDGGLLDLSKLSVRNVLFATDNTDWIKNVAVVDKGDVIMYEPPTTFIGIANMLHEIGHLVDNQRMTDKDTNISQIAYDEYNKEQYSLHVLPSKKRQERFDLVSGVILREERNAWASAISTLKPILSAFGISREDLLESIHSVSLTAYSEDIRKARIFQGGLLKVLVAVVKKLLA